MKRAALVVLVMILLATLAWLVQRTFSMEVKIARHREGWWQAVRSMVSNARLPLLRQINVFRQGDSYSFWRAEMEFHQSELQRLGYLTNCELRLTNQVMTPVFYSNFFWRIRNELGTNSDQIWVGTPLSNRAGLNPSLPAKNVAVWERIFRECALRYASNSPPTNGMAL
jgi:hypothetical protein